MVFVALQRCKSEFMPSYISSILLRVFLFVPDVRECKSPKFPDDGRPRVRATSLLLCVNYVQCNMAGEYLLLFKARTTTTVLIEGEDYICRMLWQLLSKLHVP